MVRGKMGYRTVDDQRRAMLGTPGDWIGQEVLVGVSYSGGAPYKGTLEALDQHGIVLRHELQDTARTTKEVRPVLYPWSVIHWMYPTEE